MDETAKLSLQEIQAIEFSMLEFLDSVCVEEGIEYCLFYGSALGAVRHGGFIPWDDDIDVAIKKEYRRQRQMCIRDRISRSTPLQSS